MKEALLIFAKKPELGKVKTRLAKDIGDDKALAIYKQLLAYTFDVAAQSKVHTIACFTQEDKVTLDAIAHDGFYKQEQGDLGHKMYQAFVHGKEQGFDKTVIIGTDCADLTKEIIEEAFLKLETHDVVIGPAMDGGYYLIGTKNPLLYLFQNIDWSTEKVLSQTLDAIKANDHTVCLLEELSDIDNVNDLRSKTSFFNV